MNKLLLLAAFSVAGAFAQGINGLPLPFCEQFPWYPGCPDGPKAPAPPAPPPCWPDCRAADIIMSISAAPEPLTIPMPGEPDLPPVETMLPKPIQARKE